MGKISAGVLLHRQIPGGGREVLLVHPGGPFWANKDLGAWSLPKGEIEAGETPLQAALREFGEETGWTVTAPLIPLGSIRQRGGKTVHAFAAEQDVDPATLVSPSIAISWPPRSGAILQVPEVDRAAWFDPVLARTRINVGQIPFLDRLAALQSPSP